VSFQSGAALYTTSQDAGEGEVRAAWKRKEVRVRRSARVEEEASSVNIVRREEQRRDRVRRNSGEAGVVVVELR
jgi:hypothetical protein